MFKKNSTAKIQICIFIASIMALGCPVSSVAQDQKDKTLPIFDQVLSSMDQNAAKLSSFRIRSVMVTITSPQFWGDSEEKINPNSIIAGKEVKVQRDLGVNDNGRVFLDQLVNSLNISTDLHEHTKYWLDEDKGIRYSLIQREEYLDEESKLSQLNDAIPTAYKSNDLSIPFSALGYIQINRSSKFLQSRYLRSYNARVTKMQEFRGLSCIRLDWEKPSMGGYAVKGFVLVCPSRDYKELYREMESTSNDGKEPVRKFTQKTTVGKIAKYGDSWIPSDVNYERQDFYADGQIRSLQERLRVTDFQIDPDNSIFNPLFSPGTRVFTEPITDGDSGLSIAGEDISDLAARLRSGDFSIIKQKVTDLSKP